MTIYERELLLVKDLKKLLKDIDYQMDESQKAIDSTMSEKMDLQERIDKAIEYIINHTQSTAHLEMDTKSIKQLLDILRGDE